MAIGGAAPPHPPRGGGGGSPEDSSTARRPDFEQPLLQAHAAVPARGKQEPVERDHEAQCSPEADGDGATFVRTCFNGLNALSGEYKKHSIFGRRSCSSGLFNSINLDLLGFRRWAAVDSVRLVGGRVAEPGAPARRRHGLLLHRPPPAAVHGRVAGRSGLPGHRRAGVRGQGPARRVGVPLRRALPRRHRVPDTGGGQPGQAVPGHQPRRRRARGVREAAVRRGRRRRHPADDVAEEPRRARLRVGQRRARVRRRGVLRAVGGGVRRRRVPREGEDAECQWPAYCSWPVHLLLLRSCHIPHALQLHAGKGQVLQGELPTVFTFDVTELLKA